MKILAIDPGQHESAWLVFETESGHPDDFGIEPNEKILPIIDALNFTCRHLVIEMVSHYGTGMPVGKSVFDTCVWIGRFVQCWESTSALPHALLTRQTIKAVLCGSARAKDANVRQALIDLYGGSMKAAKGTKKAPGPLYGVKTHIWSALAVAVAWAKERDDE